MKNMILTVLAVSALLTLAVSLYNSYIAYRMQCDFVKVERDPNTRIIKGAEPIYLEGKNGKACLLIHGFIGSPTDFGRLPRLLNEQGYTVSVPLLPGHGTDPRDFSKITADELIDFVNKQYAELKKTHNEVTLIGISMGGALSVITTSKQKVDRLVLLAPFFKVAHEWWYVLPAEVANKIFSPVIPYAYRFSCFKQVNKRDSIPYMRDYSYVSTKGARAGFEVSKHAQEINWDSKIPTLVIHSKGDKATDYQTTEQLTKKFGKNNIHFVTLEKSNHLILWDYESEQVENEILKFVTTKEAVYGN